MSFDRRLVDLLERIERERIDVSVSPTGGIVTCSNGCRIRVFVDLVQELHRLHREEPRKAEFLIASRAETLPRE